MKITKQGRDPKTVTWFGKCNSCGTEAEATQAELQLVYDQRDRGMGHAWRACPVCKAGDNGSGYNGLLFHKKRETPE